jgi:hypothetical protein
MRRSRASRRLASGRTSWPASDLDQATRLRDTGRAMSEQSMTPDPVDLARQAFAAVNRSDLDALMSLYAPEAVFDMTRTVGFAPQGRAAIRGFIEEWMSSYDEVEWMPDELLDLGSGVVFVVVSQRARPVGVTGYVRRRDGWVFVLSRACWPATPPISRTKSTRPALPPNGSPRNGVR